MGNIWGTAQPNFVSGKFVPAGDVALPAGTKTTIINPGSLIAPSAGAYYPLIAGVLAITLGAVAPSSLTIAFQLNAGSDVDTVIVPVLSLVALANIIMPFWLVGANSGSAWVGAGSAVTISALSAAQASTLRVSGSVAYLQLLRGLDA